MISRSVSCLRCPAVGHLVDGSQQGPRLQVQRPNRRGAQGDTVNDLEYGLFDTDQMSCSRDRALTTRPP
jgi:hypothetical protein